MAVSTYALISLTELNSALQEPADSSTQDARKETLIDRVSFEIENYLGRQLVTRGALTEYHSPRPGMRELYLRQYPLIGATSTITVYEDTGWEGKAYASWYDSTTLLTENEDYTVFKLADEPCPFVILYRIGACWAAGRRTVKVAVSSTGCGYATTAAIPAPLKAIASEVAARTWRQESQGRGSEQQSYSDALGTVGRLLPAILTTKDHERLAAYKPLDFAHTWEAA